MDLQANTSAINALHDALLNNSLICSVKTTVEQIEKKYNLQLPFTTYRQFQEFDEQLKDEEINKSLVSFSIIQLRLRKIYK